MAREMVSDSRQMEDAGLLVFIRLSDDRWFAVYFLVVLLIIVVIVVVRISGRYRIDEGGDEPK